MSEEITRKLQGLNPNTRYIIRVRSVSGFGVQSDWSEALEFVSEGDQSIPLSPIDLLVNFDGPNLLLSWTAPALNTDGTFINDFNFYQINLIPTDGSPAKIYKSQSTAFNYVFEQNELDYGTPKTSFNIEVRVFDVSGNASAPLSGVAINLPPPTSVEAPLLTAAFTIINITMTAPPIVKDLKGFDLYHSTTLVGPFTLLISTTGDSFSHQVDQVSTHYYKYKIRDIFDQLSPGFSPIANVTTGTVTDDADTTPPSSWSTALAGTPGVDLVTQEPYIDLSWASQSIDADVNHYEIRYRISGELLFVTIFKGADFTNTRLKSLINETTYEFQIRVVDNVGLESAWLPSTPITVLTGAGNLKYDTTAAGVFVVQGAAGAVRSSNWISGSTGWKLSNQGLEINQGTIRAPAIQIGVSSENLLINSSFENPTTGGTRATSWDNISIGGVTYAIDGGAGNFRYQSRSQKLSINLNMTSTGIQQTLQISDGTLKEEIQPNTWVTGSYWIRQSTGTTKNGRVVISDNTNSFDYIQPTSVVIGSAWTRVTYSVYVTGPAPILSLTFKINLLAVQNGDIFYIDGAQFQLSSYVTSYSPATLEIPDNYITNAYISSLAVDKLTTGTISAATITMQSSGVIQSFNYTAGLGGAGYQITASGAIFQNGAISIVGSSGAVTLDSTSMRAVFGGNTRFLVDASGVYLAGSIVVSNTSISSINYVSSSSGWSILNDGSAEYNNITVRGNIQGNSSSIITGGTFRTGTSPSARIQITGNTGIDSEAPALKLFTNATNVALNVLSTGIFIGGSNAGTASLYHDITNSRTVFQKTGGTGTFIISNNPTDTFVMKFQKSGVNQFTLDTSGNAIFLGTVTSSNFTSPNTVGPASGSPSSTDNIQSTGFRAGSATATVTVAAGPGSTTLTVDAISGFAGSGSFTSGGQTITYTGISGNQFTGIPGGGTGAITTTLTVNTVVSNGIGWKIDAIGNVEFNNAIFRGTISSAQVTGNLTMNGGKIRTAPNGARIELDGTTITRYTSSNTVDFQLPTTGSILLPADTGGFQLTGVGQQLQFINSASQPNGTIMMGLDATLGPFFEFAPFGGSAGFLRWVFPEKRLDTTAAGGNGRFSINDKIVPAVLNIKGALSGSPTSTSGFLIQAGTEAPTLLGGGVGTINFTTAFPNGLISVTANASNDSAAGKLVVINGGNASGFNFTVYQKTTTGGGSGDDLDVAPAGSTSVQISWIAIGF